jgi:hypothetical protein
LADILRPEELPKRWLSFEEGMPVISVDTGILLSILRGEKDHHQDDLLSLIIQHEPAMCDAAFAELCVFLVIGVRLRPSFEIITSR